MHPRHADRRGTPGADVKLSGPSSIVDNQASRSPCQPKRIDRVQAVSPILPSTAATMAPSVVIVVRNWIHTVRRATWTLCCGCLCGPSVVIMCKIRACDSIVIVTFRVYIYIYPSEVCIHPRAGEDGLSGGCCLLPIHSSTPLYHGTEAYYKRTKRHFLSRHQKSACIAS
jgi:hypothetical protein